MNSYIVMLRRINPHLASHPAWFNDIDGSNVIIFVVSAEHE